MPPEVEPQRMRLAIEQLSGVLGLGLQSAQVDGLLAYLALLQRWNATYNLTAIRDPQQMLQQHLADCLSIIAPLKQALATGGGPHGPAEAALQVLDVGSGGGLPGVVLAMLFPSWRVTCVDAVGKKVAFIRQVALELKLGNLAAHHARVEALRSPQFDLITSRAFSSLADFVRLSAASLSPKGVWMAMKGKVPHDEVAQLPSTVEVFHVEPLTVPGLDAERCLVWMRPASRGAIASKIDLPASG